VKRTLLAFAAFVAVVVAANWLTATLGLVTWLGLIATAGTWLAGFAFVARDYLQEAGGARWVIPAILLGAVISAAFSPTLALASGVAFLVSELADFAVYTPLRRSGRTRAALASNVVGAVVDSVLFLWLAGFPLSGTATQVLVKVGTTTVFVLGVRLAISRQPMQPAGGGSHA
jgi:uncharacterized PurR-regulated membrane protein YhhQ (DUF165 family)